MWKHCLLVMIFGGLSCLWVFPAFSEGNTAENVPPLTLTDCIRVALEQSPVNRKAAAEVLSAREYSGEAKAPYYPEMALQTYYKRWQSHFFLPSSLSNPGVPTIVGPTNDWMAGLNARYTLFDSGRRQAEYQGALARQGVAEEEKVRIRQDLILSVHQGFYGLAAALETRKVAKENLNRAEDHLRLARERKAAGAVSQADVLRVQVEASRARLDLVRAESLVQLSKANLNTVMGLPAEQPLEVEAKTEAVESPDRINLPLDLEQAVHKRPEIRSALKRIEAQQEGVMVTRSAFGPKVHAEGSFGWRDSNFLPKDEEWLAGIVIEWPLFSGFSRKHRLARAKAEVLKEEAEAKRILLGVKQEVMSAYSRLKETYASVQTYKVMVEEARESLRLARERYEVGAGTITDLLDAQTALAQTLAGQVEADWDCYLARSTFRKAKGELMAE